MCDVRISIIAKWKKIWHLFNQFNYEQIYSNGLRRIQINLEIKNMQRLCREKSIKKVKQENDFSFKTRA